MRRCNNRHPHQHRRQLFPIVRHLSSLYWNRKAKQRRKRSECYEPTAQHREQCINPEQKSETAVGQLISNIITQIGSGVLRSGGNKRKRLCFFSKLYADFWCQGGPTVSNKNVEWFWGLQSKSNRSEFYKVSKLFPNFEIWRKCVKQNFPPYVVLLASSFS